jgi:hypothetical protein
MCRFEMLSDENASLREMRRVGNPHGKRAGNGFGRKCGVLVGNDLDGK